jgi:hypothetical protein
VGGKTSIIQYRTWNETLQCIHPLTQVITVFHKLCGCYVLCTSMRCACAVVSQTTIVPSNSFFPIRSIVDCVVLFSTHSEREWQPSFLFVGEKNIELRYCTLKMRFVYRIRTWRGGSFAFRSKSALSVKQQMTMPHIWHAFVKQLVFNCSMWPLEYADI